MTTNKYTPRGTKGRKPLSQTVEETNSVQPNAPQQTTTAFPEKNEEIIPPVPMSQRRRLRSSNPQESAKSFSHVDKKFMHEGLHYSWQMESDIPRRLEEGYALTRGVEPRVANIRSDGKKMYLMDIPLEYYNQDMAAYVSRVRRKTDVIIDQGSENPSEGAQLTGVTSVTYT